MSVSLFGLLTLLLGIWCQFLSYRASVYTIFGLCVLGATAALDLPALGGASVTPANLFLGFLLLRLVSTRGGLATLLGRIGPRQPLFLFFLLTFWIIASGILLPRLFAGATFVFSLSRSVTTDGVSPLGPTTGNITQAVYASAGLLAACAICSFAQRPDGHRAVLRGILLVTFCDIAFALLDLVTSATHTGFLLDVVHTASYAFLTDDETGGLKRISGSFSEASSFASFSLLLLGVNLTLYTRRVATRATGFASIALLLLITLATSSAGYVGLAVLGLGYGAYAAKALIVDRNTRAAGLLLVSVGVVYLAMFAIMLLLPRVAETAKNVLDATLLTKADSDSAVERGSWNLQAWKIFMDTYGLGGGIGCTRSSNYALVLLSNTGLIGFLLYAGLMLRATSDAMSPEIDHEARSVVWAARAGLLTVIVPNLLVATVYDLGMMYYCLLGVAVSGYGRRRVAARGAHATVAVSTSLQ